MGYWSDSFARAIFSFLERVQLVREMPSADQQTKRNVDAGDENAPAANSFPERITSVRRSDFKRAGPPRIIPLA